jgi:Domain of unknown function (DUF4382)
MHGDEYLGRKTMRTINGRALAVALGLFVGLVGCSSGDHATPNKGNFVMALSASGSAAGGATNAATAGPAPANGDHGPTAANVTISAASARTSDGTWVPVQGTFPITVDVIALAAGGGTETLPADILPEGHYDGIKITITAVNLTLHDGTTVAITPPGTGWEVVIPVSFDVVAGQETVVNLNLRCDHSFGFLNGEFEFHPDIECGGVGPHD